MRAIGSSLLLLSFVTLSACAPVIWDRPGTTSAELSMDSAQCQLYAEGVVPSFDAGTISTGHVKRDLAANAAVGIIGAMAQGVAVSQKRDLCMQAKGYIAHAPGALPIAAAAASPPALPVSPAAPVPLLAPPMMAGAIPVSILPVAPAVVGSAVPAVCPPGLNPRWSDPKLGSAPVMICIRGNQYPEFMWRYAAAYGF